MISELVDTLIAAGYRTEGNHLALLGVNFAFDRVLSGPDNQTSLVVLLAAQPGELNKVRRRLRNLVAALSRTDSYRPITAVIVGTPRSDGSDVADICPTIYVGPGDDPKAKLGPLLPLTLPAPVESRESAEDVLRHKLGTAAQDALFAELLAAARLGAEQVEAVLFASLDKAATPKDGS